MVDRRIFDPARASHTIEASAVAQHCELCGEPAAHCVAERISVPNPPMTGHLCCTHFIWIVGDCQTYPYYLPVQRSEDT